MAGAGLTHADWLSRVPTLLAEAAAAWGLTTGEAYPAGAAGPPSARSCPTGRPRC